MSQQQSSNIQNLSDLILSSSVCTYFAYPVHHPFLLYHLLSLSVRERRKARDVTRQTFLQQPAAECHTKDVTPFLCIRL